MMYLVIALYEDNDQRWGDSIEADDPEHAEMIAQRRAYFGTQEPDDIDPDDWGETEIDESDHPLKIAGVIKMDGSYEIVA